MNQIQINTTNKLVYLNVHIKRKRAKFQESYFERYPEKLEEVLLEEQEKNKKKIRDKPTLRYDIIDELPKGKRSISLGIRNQGFKASNLTLIKEKGPKLTHLNNSESNGLRPVRKYKILNETESLRTQMSNKNYSTGLTKNGLSVKASQRQKPPRAKIPRDLPLPK